VLQRGAPDSEYELTELWQTLPEREHYSYIFEGNGQVLDHILASRALLAPRPDFGPVHMNTEFDEEQQSRPRPAARAFPRDGREVAPARFAAAIPPSVSGVPIGVSILLAQVAEYPGRGYGTGKNRFVQQAEEELAELKRLARHQFGKAFNCFKEQQRREE
jgi:hypothetical protein